MAELWTDFTDAIITSIDSDVKADAKMTLRELLTDPAKFAKEDNVQARIKAMRGAADEYVEKRIKEMSNAEKALEDSIAKADALSSQLGQSISVKAMQNKVPLIKPVAIDRDITKEERILINAIDANVAALVDKLASSSTLIADFGAAYKNYRIGEWLFSGQKNYVLAVYLERNELLLMQGSKTEIDTLMDTASNFIRGL